MQKVHAGEKVCSYNVGMGYVIGSGPEVAVATSLDDAWLESQDDLRLWLAAGSLNDGTEPEDFTEFLGEMETPSSRFEEQLLRRLDCSADSLPW